MFIPWLAQRGVPDFLQDWTSPVVGNLGDYYLRGSLSWRADGIGEPNAFRETSPLLLFFEGVYRVCTPEIAPRLFVIVLVIALAFSTMALCLSLGVRRVVSVVAALLIVASPFTYVQIVAGHQFILCGLALLPVVILLSIRAQRGSIAAAAALGALVGFSSLQVQYVAFDLAAIVIVVASSGRFPSRATIGALLTAACLVAPLFLSLNRWSSEIPFDHANLTWEGDQSVPLFDAFLGLGYFTHYAEKSALSSFFRGIAILFAALSIVGTITISRVRSWGVTWLVFALLAAGIRGPLGSIEIWTFGHVAAASAFRELYDFIGPSQLAEAIAVALTIDGLIGVSAFYTRAVAFVAALRLLIFVSLPVAIPAYRVSPDVVRALQIVASDSSSSRILMLPFWGPLRFRLNASAGGTDPFAYAVGTHMPINSQPIEPASALSSWAVSGDVGILKRLGVGFVLIRRDLESTTIGYAGVTSLALDPIAIRRNLTEDGYEKVFDAPNAVLYAAPQSIVAIGNARSVPLSLHAALAESISGPCPGGHSKTVEWPSDIADPRFGWVPAVYWLWYAPNLSSAARSLFSVANRPPPIPHRFVLSAKPGASARFTWKPVGLMPRGPSVVSGVSDDSCATFTAEARLAVTTNDVPLAGSMQTPLRGVFRTDSSANGRTLVFRERYDSRWRLVLQGREISTHFITNGFMNAWSLPPGVPDRTEVEISFREERHDIVVLLIVWVIYGACTLAVIITGLRSRFSR